MENLAFLLSYPFDQTLYGVYFVSKDLIHLNFISIFQDDSIKKDTTTLATPTVQHRLAGGGIAPEMLKDPNENERMERVKRYL